jgi:hypothetical protein
MTKHDTTETLYARAMYLGRLVLTRESRSLTLAEFSAEPLEEQQEYVRWLEVQARDIRRESRYG